MSLLKITNRDLKGMRKDVQITNNVRKLLIEEKGCTIIKINDIKKLFVECGGSPFNYLLKYTSNFGWEESDNPYNFYYYFEKDSKLKLLDESELSKKMIDECLNMMNYPSIGNELFWKLTNTKFKNNKLTETYIPFSLVMDLLSIETQNDYYIIGCDSDIDEINCLKLEECKEYFEEEVEEYI